MAYLVDKLQPTKSPALPIGTVEYSRQYQDQLNKILRLYFSQVDSTTQSLSTNTGGRFIGSPYGEFSDDTDQVAVSTTTAYAIQFSTTEQTNSVTLVSNSRITAEFPGIYSVQASAEFVNNAAGSQTVNIWLMRNGVNVVNSNKIYSVNEPVDTNVVAVYVALVELQGADYIEIMWRTSDVNVYMKHTAIGAAPVRPATPSVRASMSFVSSIPA
jgi:hypothetical protein